jgi:hypothetical protein
MYSEPELQIWPDFYEAEMGEGGDAGYKGAIITVEEIRKYWN